MGTVTGITAAKAMEILNGTIKEAEVDGDGHLILTRYDDTTVDAGSVIGPEGDPGPAGSLTIPDVLDVFGKGIIALDRITTDEDWGLLANTFTDVPGLSITETLTVGRTYRFEAGAVLSNIDAGGAHFDMEIYDTTDGVIARATVDSGASGRGAGLSPVAVLTAGVGWGVSRVFKARVRCDVATLSTIQGTYTPAFLSITDLGVI